MHVEFAIKALSQAHDESGKVFDSAEYLNDTRTVIIGCILLSTEEAGPELTYFGVCGNNETLLTWRAFFNDDFTLEQVWSSLSFGLPVNCELLWMKKIVARNCFGDLRRTFSIKKTITTNIFQCKRKISPIEAVAT